MRKGRGRERKKAKNFFVDCWRHFLFRGKFCIDYLINGSYQSVSYSINSKKMALVAGYASDSDGEGSPHRATRAPAAKGLVSYAHEHDDDEDANMVW